MTTHNSRTGAATSTNEPSSDSTALRNQTNAATPTLVSVDTPSIAALIPFDEGALRGRIDAHTSAIWAAYEEVARDMQRGVQQMLAHIGGQLERQLKELEAQCDQALADIRRTEQEQEQIRQQLLEFVRILNDAYADLFCKPCGSALSHEREQ
ncbi:hypothetical protein THASP1DRAFT_33015 [Thamnocephalis sphaerospora]|uniref:Uncharacterized protein n=1 Tax=Thamnocephalis sphaerospora TaxID=78915 RepID=A0A4P9XHH5_9FUNG|nr:hypothetical protein THASP1DRAFT_33015 [Thamnocephalis sphaerospora]|eukprot:RKP05144.1 hypothetical protein THASP1DRAFT_33015 [Thamnocephalis sphaerospora]